MAGGISFLFCGGFLLAGFGALSVFRTCFLVVVVVAIFLVAL